MNIPFSGSNQGSQVSTFNNQLYMLSQHPLVQQAGIVFTLFPLNYWLYRATLFDALDVTDVNVATAKVDQILDADIATHIQKVAGPNVAPTGAAGIAGMQRTGTGG